MHLLPTASTDAKSNGKCLFLCEPARSGRHGLLKAIGCHLIEIDDPLWRRKTKSTTNCNAALILYQKFAVNRCNCKALVSNDWSRGLIDWLIDRIRPMTVKLALSSFQFCAGHAGNEKYIDGCRCFYWKHLLKIHCNANHTLKGKLNQHQVHKSIIHTWFHQHISVFHWCHYFKTHQINLLVMLPRMHWT